MSKDLLIEVIERSALRRMERRAFLRASGGAAAAMTLLSGCFNDDDDDDDDNIAGPTPPAPTPAPVGITDADILNFALNLEYLEAQFYSFAVNGTGLPANLLTGTGTQGAATGGRAVPFTDPVVRQYAKEIVADETAHVVFLRGALASAAVSQPPIDIGISPTGAFSSAARAAGLIGAGASFDPYLNDENFLLGAYIFEDVGVTGYKGASPLITSKVFLEAAAGLLAAEAYHASLIRTTLYRKGLATPSLRTSADRISDARDSLDGPTDLDQGISPTGSGTTQSSNIVPTDADGLAYSRTTGRVLNILYLTPSVATQGGFFPAGLNGTIRSSTSG